MRSTSTYSLLLVATLLCVCVRNSLAFQFSLPSDSMRCFTEEVPSNTDLSVSYAAKSAYAQFLDVTLTLPDGLVLWEERGKDTGKHQLRLSEGKELTICFHSRLVRDVKSSATSRSVDFTWKVGAANINYKDLATREKLKPVEVQLRVLEDAIANIHTEYVYYKEKEAEMRSTSEHMTAKVMWIAVVVIVIFVAFSYWQMRHLKRYFRKKRMID